MSSEIEAILNRMSIFSGAELDQSALALEEIAGRPNLYRFIEPRTLERLCDFVSRSQPDNVLKAVCLVISNSCTLTDDTLNVRILLMNDIASRSCDVLQQGKSSAVRVFAILDVMATLCTAFGEARTQLRPAIPLILDAVRCHKTNSEILFATSCTLATLTLAEPLNSLALARAKGLQVLLEIFKYTCRQKTNVQTDKGELQILDDILKWSKQAMMNTIRCPSAEVATVLNSTNFGIFGDVVAVDELKIQLSMERKKIDSRIHHEDKR